jgi:glutaredoxin
MKKMLFAFISCMVVFSSQDFSEAEMYKYVDEKGQVHYTNVPPQETQSTQKVEKVEPKGGVSIMGAEREEPETPSERSMSLIDILKDKLRWEKEQESEKEQSRELGQSNEVDLYVTSWCGYCKRARNFLISKGIDFNEYDIEKDEEAARRKRELDRRRGVPFAVINGHKTHGWSQPAYERALNLN